MNVGARGGVSAKLNRVTGCMRVPACDFDVCGHGRGYDRGVDNVVVGCVRPRERVRQRCG